MIFTENLFMKKFVIVIALISIVQSNVKGQVAQLYRANIVQPDTIKEVKLFDKDQYLREVEGFKNMGNSFESTINVLQQKIEMDSRETQDVDVDKLKKEVEELEAEIDRIKKKKNKIEQQEKGELEKKELERKKLEQKIKEEEEQKKIGLITDSINLIYIMRDANLQIENKIEAFKQTREHIFVIEKNMGFIFNENNEKREEILKMHRQLFSLKEDTDNYKREIDVFADSISKSTKYYGRIQVFINYIDIENKRIKISYDTLSVRTARLMKQVEDCASKWKKEKLDTQTSNQDIIGALPQIAIKNKVAPSITLLGAKEFKKLGWHKISIYAGNDNGFDTTMLAQLVTPEVSKYGINFSGTYNLKDITKDSSYKSVFNYLININSKDFNLVNNGNLEYTQLNVKLGYENIIVDKVLSLYGSFNFNSPLSRKKEFLAATQFSNATQYYFDFGVKVLLGNEKVNDFGFYLDLNFFNLTDDFKKLADTEDSLGLSSIKVGVQKTF